MINREPAGCTVSDAEGPTVSHMRHKQILHVAIAYFCTRMYSAASKQIYHMLSQSMGIHLAGCPKYAGCLKYAVHPVNSQSYASCGASLPVVFSLGHLNNLIITKLECPTQCQADGFLIYCFSPFECFEIPFLCTCTSGMSHISSSLAPYTQYSA